MKSAYFIESGSYFYLSIDKIENIHNWSRKSGEDLEIAVLDIVVVCEEPNLTRK